MSSKLSRDLFEPMRHLRGLSGVLYALAGLADGSNVRPESLEVLGESLSNIHIRIAAAMSGCTSDE